MSQRKKMLMKGVCRGDREKNSAGELSAGFW